MFPSCYANYIHFRNIHEMSSSKTKMKRANNSLSRGNHSAPRIEICYWPIRQLKLDSKNPRTHHTPANPANRPQHRTIRVQCPILVDATLKVIAGHGRVMACQELGWREVPTIALEHLSDAQAKAFAIADNRLTENSKWDERLLAGAIPRALLARPRLLTSK